MKKKILLTILILMMCSPVFAQARGALTNVFASWYSVTTATTTVRVPVKSRDVYIRNGDSSAICVGLTGSAMTTDSVCNTTFTNDLVQLDGDSEIDLRDFVTESITLGSLTGTASPVTVIITY